MPGEDSGDDDDGDVGEGMGVEEAVEVRLRKRTVELWVKESWHQGKPYSNPRGCTASAATGTWVCLSPQPALSPPGL